jgi:hypothetical protein
MGVNLHLVSGPKSKKRRVGKSTKILVGVWSVHST